MKFNELNVSANRKSSRVGSGISAGRGKQPAEEPKARALARVVAYVRDLKAVRCLFICASLNCVVFDPSVNLP
jgi:hypothetical protein